VTAAVDSALMLAGLFLGEGIICMGVAREEHLPVRGRLFLNGLLAKHSVISLLEKEENQRLKWCWRPERRKFSQEGRHHVRLRGHLL
jgi:hypothetical protein